jgi:hypothetical protein
VVSVWLDALPLFTLSYDLLLCSGVTSCFMSCFLIQLQPISRNKNKATQACHEGRGVAVFLFPKSSGLDLAEHTCVFGLRVTVLQAKSGAQSPRYSLDVRLGL